MACIAHIHTHTCISREVEWLRDDEEKVYGLTLNKTGKVVVRKKKLMVKKPAKRSKGPDDDARAPEAPGPDELGEGPGDLDGPAPADPHDGGADGAHEVADDVMLAAWAAEHADLAAEMVDRAADEDGEGEEFNLEDVLLEVMAADFDASRNGLGVEESEVQRDGEIEKDAAEMKEDAMKKSRNIGSHLRVTRSRRR